MPTLYLKLVFCCFGIGLIIYFSQNIPYEVPQKSTEDVSTTEFSLPNPYRT